MIRTVKFSLIVTMITLKNGGKKAIAAKGSHIRELYVV